MKFVIFASESINQVCMRNILEDRERRRRIVSEIQGRPEFRRLKFWTYAMAAAGIVLLFVMLLWIDSMSWTMLLVMRGCTGLFLLAFIILAVILKYRINAEYLRNRW